MERCFDAGKMDTQLFAQGQMAFSYILKTWEYDGKRLADEASSAYQRTTPNEQNCRRAEAYAYEAVGRTRDHRTQSQARSQANAEAWSEVLKQSSQNRPVYCNTIGTMTMCN